MNDFQNVAHKQFVAHLEGVARNGTYCLEDIGDETHPWALKGDISRLHSNLNVVRRYYESKAT